MFQTQRDNVLVSFSLNRFRLVNVQSSIEHHVKCVCMKSDRHESESNTPV